MVSVEEIIGNLLLRHNCVIIPGFGGFVAKQTSARIDYKNGIITPPGKSLLFNRQLMTNDGLLVSEFAHQNEITYNDAVSAVNQRISGWNTELSSGNRVSIDRVGFLFFDQERNICFEQDRYFNLLLSSYGLSSVHFLTETDVAIAQQKIEVIEQPSISIASEVFSGIQQEEKSIVELPVTPVAVEKKPQAIVPAVTRTKSNFWKYAAAACAIPILFYSFWIPMKTDVLESRIISFQDFNPFHQPETAVYKQHPVQDLLTSKSEKVQSLDEQLQTIESNENIYSYNLTDETYVLIKIDNSEEGVVPNETAITGITPIAANVNQPTGSLNYIVGCFSDETNAENLVNELKTKGFNAFIKDRKGGLSRVSIGSVDSQEAMKQLMSRANTSGYSGWILK